MSFASLQNWILVDSCCIEGLGQGELMQSAHSSVGFKATIVLNSYESNCLRDWLAHRWKSMSLAQTCLLLHDDKGLVVTLPFEAKNLIDAKQKFGAWLSEVLVERERAANSRS